MASTPLIGAANDHFAGRQVGAAIITIAIFLVILLMRRYWAASDAGWNVRQSLRFALWPWASRTGTGDASGKDVTELRGLLVGTDNRVSTSKATAFLWTLVLVYFLVSMAVIFGTQTAKYTSLINSISLLYLVLLGGPFAAAVLAKGIVAGSADAGQTQKSQASSPHVADVFSDDDGNTDLVDTQYFVFNIVVAVIVMIQFVHAPGFGAPAIPDFLATLTGASAATYVANKAVVTGTNPPSIDQLAPSRVRPGGLVTAFGRNLVAQGDAQMPLVTVGSLPAASAESATAGRLTFRVPIAAVADAAAVSVVIRTPSGLVASGSTTVTIIEDALTVSDVSSHVLHPGAKFTVTGTGFFPANAVDEFGQPVATKDVRDGIRATLSLTAEPPVAAGQNADPAICAVEGDESDSQLTAVVPDNLLNGGKPQTFRLTVQRGAKLKHLITGLQVVP